MKALNAYAGHYFSGGGMIDESDEKTLGHLEAMGFERVGDRWQRGDFVATVKGQAIDIKRRPRPRLVASK
jgi:hypothetical protein